MQPQPILRECPVGTVTSRNEVAARVAQDAASPNPDRGKTPMLRTANPGAARAYLFEQVRFSASSLRWKFYDYCRHHHSGILSTSTP